MAQQKTIAISASGDNFIHNVSNAGHTAVFDYVLTASTSVIAIIKDGAGNEFGRYYLYQTNPGVIANRADGERFTAKGDIIINLSVQAFVTGHFTYMGKDA